MPRPFGVAENPSPRLEGAIPLPDGRRLGFGEYGDPRGVPLLWFHGSPGARRQVSPAARCAAELLGIRLVCLERPGVGLSSDHAYREVRDWSADVAVAADHLGHDRFLVLGLSGGGPYALACAHDLPERVVAVGILGGLVPTTGAEAAAAGIVALARRYNRLLSAFRVPLGMGLWGVARVFEPVAHPLYRAYTRLQPHGDSTVLDDPAIEAMLVDDFRIGSRRQFRAFVNDLVVVGRPWGFRLADIRVPVRWWHGDADPFVPLDQAERTTALLRDVELHVRPGESHLGGFAVADEMLATQVELWRQRVGG